MAFTLQNLVIFLLAFLPGVTARVYTRRYIPQTRQPTVLEEITASLQATVLIHSAGIVVFVLFFLIWQKSQGSFHAELLISKGLTDYFQTYPLRTVITSLAYVAYLGLASIVVGTLNIPHRLSDFCTTALSMVPLLNKLVPSEILYPEPVWYTAFRVGRPPNRPFVYVSVRMKSGDIYRGTLKIYPILGDDVKSKDFVISDGFYLPQGDESRRQILNDQVIPGFGGILLNSQDVDAIEFAYAHGPEEETS